MTNKSGPTTAERTVSAAGVHGPWPQWREHRRRAEELVQQMELTEKLTLVSVPLAVGDGAPEDAIGSAAYCAGVKRLGVPAWNESDASLGVTNPDGIRGDQDQATAFPSLVALGATFDVDLAHRMGRALGEEARQKGMSVQLAGGINLIREPRGGRVFEYISEDVLLSGVIAGHQVAGIQSQGVVSTLKHYAINPQETGRVMVSSNISDKALRESDLLAFEIAIEHGQPRAIMTGYNLVNSIYATEHPYLINTVLKGDWGFAGFVMSDWGATHSTEHSAWAGLDRQSGSQLDTAHFYGEPLRRAVESGRVAMSRLDDMAARVLTALGSVGALEQRRQPEAVSLKAHGEIAREVAQRSIVLLRNEGSVLPLSDTGGRIVVVGGRGDTGVLSGGGSSTVRPQDSVIDGGLETPQIYFPRVYHGPGPFQALAERFGDREVVFFDSDAAAENITDDDVAVVVVQKWASESQDSPDLSAGAEQDELVRTMAAKAKSTIVVLESAGPMTLPWFQDVDAVLAAWYGGSGGAAAIADAISGDLNPSGRLPVSFPQTERDLPRLQMTDPESTTSAPGVPRQGDYISVDYNIEGADVGYRWHERSGAAPLLPFGYGLSYTRFEYSGISAEVDSNGNPVVSVTVTNTGERHGVEVPQVYIAPPQEDAPQGRAPLRLACFAALSLDPGESQTVRLVLDEDRLYSAYDLDRPGWTRAEGSYRVRVARTASSGIEYEQDIELAERRRSYHVTG